MDSALTTVGLPVALAIIMLGLGLDLTLADFRRVGRHPRAVAIALACQLVLLPLVCFGLVVLFDLPALLGIGMMLLAASPGGTSANLYSHLFRGDIALSAIPVHCRILRESRRWVARDGRLCEAELLRLR